MKEDLEIKDIMLALLSVGDWVTIYYHNGQSRQVKIEYFIDSCIYLVSNQIFLRHKIHYDEVIGYWIKANNLIDLDLSDIG